MSKNIFSFKDLNLPTIGQVGGKGYSLIKMSQAGFNIPPGFVLATAFFQPWIDELE